ncbi:beta-N-acetylhexosaminidase [Sphingopyxis sp.]|uniref:beta-N-acetylhexosaminidase n=1 Tax=Sphingopyxis sp. TaxID=1908224 RepID=UPI002D79CB3C|nr:family 20 glycosylhydrolase [Sphingopyxis sp.]HET6526312.1 family 20 glycosylhydrolase [Sphingopyxis sp.]
MKFFGALAATLAAFPVYAAPALMPLPVSVVPDGTGVLRIEGPLKTGWEGCGNAALLERAATRLGSDILRQTGLILDPAKPIAVRATCRSAQGGVDRGEAYRVTVGSEGVAIEADGPTGVLRAYASLRQLAGLSPAGIAIAHQTITDAPRFAWRGIMLDPARHFISVATLKRQIDAMERLKFNTLHLHLSDDQGFRVESLKYPKLNADGEYYRQSEIRDLVAYAADRGVRIVPEFDVPGHSRAIVTAYPEVGTFSKTMFLGQPEVALNPASEKTYRFLERLFGEMAPLFPDPHFHIGGDEVSKTVWADAEDVQALMARENLADSKAVEAFFLRRAADIVRRLGKTVIGWEEVSGAGLPKDSIVQAWQTSNAMADATAKGHRTIMSAGYYLNLLMPADYHYGIDPAATAAAGLTPEHAKALRGLSPLLANFVTDALVDFPHAPLSAEQEKLLIGAEAPLWGEIATDELIDHHLWPRAAALAERFWSPASVTDAPDMYRRLAIVSAQLTVSGLDDRANRQRIAARIVPDDNGAVADLLAITGPVRNMAHDHRIKAMLAGQRIVQPLNALADTAPVDSLAARRFADEAKRYVAGERALGAPLKAQLGDWRANEARFGAIATGNPMLEPARPTATLIAAVAAAGLDALEALETGRPLTAAQVENAKELLARLEKEEAASWRPFDSFLRPQPAADLIVKIGPGIRTLVEAAAK